MKKITLSSVLILTGILATTAVNATEVNYDSNGAVEFIPNTDLTDPVNPLDPDPENPVRPVDPTNPSGPQNQNSGTNGPLSIDYASSFDFGVNKISNKNQTYFARAQAYYDRSGAISEETTPNYVQISDNRGTNAGWTLKVKQNGQFKNEETLNEELTGSMITLTDAVVTSNAVNVLEPTAVQTINLDADGAESIVMSASTVTGAGTWLDYWGEVETVTEVDAIGAEVLSDVTKAVSLFVPGSTPKDAVSYQTTLTWTLSDVPGV